MTSRATRPFAKVTTRSSPSRRQSVTNPGARRVWTAYRSRNASHAREAGTPRRNSFRSEAMAPCSSGSRRGSWRKLLRLRLADRQVDHGGEEAERDVGPPHPVVVAARLERFSAE